MLWKRRQNIDLKIQQELSRQQIAEQKRSNRIGRLSIGLSLTALVVAAVTLTVAIQVDTTPTRVVTVRPFGFSGIPPPTESQFDGTCINSVLSNRPDAVRCFYRDVVDDPCFRSPYRTDPLEVICIRDVQQTKYVLVRAPDVPPLSPDVPTDSFIPFLLLLDGGIDCVLSSGAGPIAVGVEREAFYACGPDESEFFAHTVNTQNAIWTIHVIESDGADETIEKVVAAYR